MTFFPTRILVATDGSAESGLAEVAAEFSGELDSELHVLHVGQEVPVLHFESGVQAQFEEAAQESLAGEVKRIEEAGGTVTQSHLIDGSFSRGAGSGRRDCGQSRLGYHRAGGGERLPKHVPPRSLLYPGGPRKGQDT